MHHINAELGAVSEIIGYCIRLKEKSGDYIGDSVVTQQIDDVVHHRFVHDRYHRFRDIHCKGTQPGTESPCHYDCLHSFISRDCLKYNMNNL